MNERNVIVRTYSAGVHYGRLVEQHDKHVVLTAARRIWSWRERNTLHEISLRGVGKGSRVSEEIARIELTEAIEILDCTPEAVANLNSPAEWK